MSNKDKITISIICTVYNHEKYLRKCLDGFIMQKTNFQFEAIVHDDASTDSSADILREYAQKYPNIIKPIYQIENQYSKGLPISRTFIHPRCKGEYWAICEGDDYWTDKNKLQKQYDFMINNPNCSCCGHGAIQIDHRNCKQTYFGPSQESRYLTAEEIILVKNDFVATCSLVLKKEVIETQPDCFFCKGGIGDYQIRMYASFIGDFYYMSETMGTYNFFSTPSSWTSQMNEEKKAFVFININNMLRKVDKHFSYKYTNSIQERIKKNEINILMWKGEYSKIKKLYPDYYTSLELKGKLKLFLNIYAPWLLQLLLKCRAYCTK